MAGDRHAPHVKRVVDRFLDTGGVGAFGADFTRVEVQSVLATVRTAQTTSFAGRSLAGLDLHDLDFTAVDLSDADLSDADLRGTKLVAAKLVGAKLPRAKLNLAWIMRADFSYADLSGSCWRRSLFRGMETLPDEAARSWVPISRAPK